MDNKLDGGSLDVERVELERLFAAFPQCFVEGKFDVKKLAALCGEYDDNDFEKYKFEWKGKDASLRLAQQRSMGTLRPCPAESVDWDTTQNLYIEGDNLEVLKQLQTAYYRKVKMIYIDPPYNTGNDFVYEDDFADPIQKYKEVTAQTTRSNPETMGRFHTNWLNMMYPRLRLASNLLTDDGVIFISIDDNEVHNLRKLCDEVFGEENFVAQLIWKQRKGGGNDSKFIAIDHEYILIYAKSSFSLPNNWRVAQSDEYLKRYSQIDENGDRYYWDTLSRDGLKNPIPIKLTAPDGSIVNLNSQKSLSRIEEGLSSGTIRFAQGRNGWTLHHRIYMSDGQVMRSILDDAGTNRESGNTIFELFGEQKVFGYSKPNTLIMSLLRLCTTSDDIILDFFSGSATTAHAVMQLNKEDGGNRRFICVQLPELTDENSEAYKAGYKNICEIGKERIRRAGAKIKSEWEAEAAKRSESLFSGDEKPQTSLDTGFRVFKLDTSNLKTWDATPVDSDDAQQLELLLDRMNTMVETIKTDRSDEDVVYEIMLKMGFPPSYSVTPVEIDGKRAYSVGDECLLLVCLQEGLTAATIERMAEDYLPPKIAISEKCFADDTAMANAHYILENRQIELKLV